jgi:hypothetical protein
MRVYRIYDLISKKISIMSISTGYELMKNNELKKEILQT